MDLSFILPILVSGTGLYFLVRLRFFFILHPIRTARRLVAALRERGARRSLSLALAGTLGVGNIFGVAMGIIIGGAGSVFWLLASSVFSAVIKYAEATLTLDLDRGEGGGMASVIRATYPRGGAFFSKVYAVLCLILALVMGSAIQSDSVSEVVEATLGIQPYLVALILAFLVGVTVFGGARKIASVTEIVIPLTTLIYIIMSFATIFVNRERLGDVVSQIFFSAFSLPAASGGAVAVLFSRAMREGYARGILSNEAGAGTSAMAHETSGADPATAGLFGICEVFFDTPLLCTLTAVSVLSAVSSPSDYTSAMALVADAFCTSLGTAAIFPLVFCVLAFAYSTVVCWYYYGSECTRYLTGREMRWLYAPAFLTFIFVGALADSFLTLAVTDLVLLLMSLLTLAALVTVSPRLVELTVLGGLLKEKNSRRRD